MFNPFYKHPPLRCHPAVARVNEAALLEIGPGRGDFLFELARQNPDILVAAVEIKRKRYEKLKPRLKRLSLDNVVLINGDARVALPALFRPQQFAACYILFSDPWPKDKHEKHRLFQPYFVHELARIMQPAGELVVAHDDERYLDAIKTMLAMHPSFAVGARSPRPPALETSPGGETPPLRFDTFYAAKWQNEGRTLQSCRYTVSEIPKIEFERAAQDSGWAGFVEWHDHIHILNDP